MTSTRMRRIALNFGLLVLLGLGIGLAAGAAPAPAQAAALRRLESDSGAKCRVRNNGLMRTTRVRSADKPLSPPSEGSPDGIARGVLYAYRDVRGMSEGEVDALRPTDRRRAADPSGDRRRVDHHARRSGSEGAAIVLEAGRFRAPVRVSQVITFVPGKGSGTAENGPVVIP